MSALRRAIILIAVAAAAAAALLAGPASIASASPTTPASADGRSEATSAAAGPSVAIVRVTGKLALVDDDWDYDPTTSAYIDKVYAVDGRSGETDIEIKAPACAGGEVRATVNLTLSYTAQLNRLYVRPTPLTSQNLAGLRMFEGTSCSSTDLDGTASFSGFYLPVNHSGSFTMSTGNQDEGGNDRATVNLKVERTQ